MSITNCPICENKENLMTIEKIYFGILENDQSLLNRLNIYPNQKKQLLKELRPPGLDKQPIWLILAPDILASIFLFFFLFVSIFNILDGSQSALQFSLLTIFLFSLFLIFRKKIITAFQGKKDAREVLVNKTAEKIELWSTLWICMKDKIIFNPDYSINLSLAKFQNFLAIDE